MRADFGVLSPFSNLCQLSLERVRPLLRVACRIRPLRLGDGQLILQIVNRCLAAEKLRVSQQKILLETGDAHCEVALAPLRDGAINLTVKEERLEMLHVPLALQIDGGAHHIFMSFACCKLSTYTRHLNGMTTLCALDCICCNGRSLQHLLVMLPLQLDIRIVKAFTLVHNLPGEPSNPISRVVHVHLELVHLGRPRAVIGACRRPQLPVRLISLLQPSRERARAHELAAELVLQTDSTLLHDAAEVLVQRACLVHLPLKGLRREFELA